MHGYIDTDNSVSYPILIVYYYTWCLTEPDALAVASRKRKKRHTCTPPPITACQSNECCPDSSRKYEPPKQLLPF